MKNRFLFLSLIAVLVLTSCQNFLTSSELKEAIEKEILIANSNIPEILSAEPKLIDGGVYSDSNIIVSFSKPMDSKYLSDFSNITITDSNGTNLANHYLSPVLSSDGRTLTVAHDPSNYITVEEGSLKTVKVTLSKNIQDTETIPLKNDYTWTYNINSKKDDKAPEFLSGTTLKGSSAPMQEGTFANLITTLGADNFFTDTYHVNSVNIDLKSSDSGSGVAKLIVKEKLLYGVSGIDVRENNISKETIFTDFLKEGISYSLSTKYDFSQDFADGIVELTLIIEDKCGNKSEKTFAMVKDTEVTANYDNAFGDDANPDVSKTESNNYFEIKNITSKPWATWNNNVYYDMISFEKIELLDSDKNHIESGDKLDENRLYYKFNSISNDYCYYINAVFSDDAGNTASNLIHLNSSPTIVSFFDGDYNKTNTYAIWLNDTSESDPAEIIAYYKTDSEYTTLNEDSKTMNIFISKDTTSVYFRIKYYSPYEFGLYSNEITNFNINPNYKSISKDMFTCTITPYSDSNKGYQLKVIINDDNFLKLQNKSVKISTPYGGDFAKSFPCTGKEMTITISNENIRTLFMTAYPSPYENEEKKVCIGLQAFDPAGYTSSSFKTINNKYDTWYKDNEWQVISLQSVTNYLSQDTDLYSPVITIPNSISSPNAENNYSISVRLIANDLPNLTDAFLTKDGKLPVKLFYTDKSSIYDLSKNEIQLLDCIETELYITEISSDKKIVTGFVPLTKVFEEFCRCDNKEFDCYVWVEDRSGNVSWEKISYLYLGAEFNVVYDSTDFLDKFYVTQNESATYEMKMIPIGRTIPDGHAGYPYKVMNNDLKTGDENVKSSLYNYVNDNYSPISPTFVELKVSLSPKQITGKNYQTEWYIDDYSYYVYTHKTTCNLKNLFENNDKLTIFNDKPVLVHTVCSPVNFGKDIHSWEAWSQNGYKLNEKIIDPATTGMNFNNYDYPSASDIPTGWYYAAIIYFADNTSTIGTVFQN